MKQVYKSLFWSVRPVNLLIIAATMMVTRYGVIQGLIGPMEFHLQSDHFLFGLLVISTLLIASAGNLINDYFDTKIDSVNKPEKMTVGVTIKPFHAILIHSGLSFIGVILGFYVGLKSGMWYLGLFPLLASFFLWLYSAFLKRMFLIGNIIIALIAGSTLILVGLFEINQLSLFYLPDLYKLLDGNELGLRPEYYFEIIWVWVALFAAFAAYYNLIREILKDWQDLKGDAEVNSSTFPILAGVKATRWLIAILLAIGLIALFGIWSFLLRDSVSLGYFLLILAFSLRIIWDVFKKNPPLKTISRNLKIVMVLGVLFGCLVPIILH